MFYPYLEVSCFVPILEKLGVCPFSMKHVFLFRRHFVYSYVTREQSKNLWNKVKECVLVSFRNVSASLEVSLARGCTDIPNICKKHLE